jgi:hypothetical protein
MEQHYAFIKDNVVKDILVFATQDEELADRVAHEKGFDDAVWVGKNVPVMFSSYDGITFTRPTDEYLISIGVKDAWTPPPSE